MSNDSLTVNMKATIALIIAFIVYFVVDVAATTLTGPLDIYADLSLVLLIPACVLLYFCRKGKPWAFVGTSVFGLFLVIALPFNASTETWQQLTPLFDSLTTIAAMLFALMALEGFKAYLESKS